MFKVKNNLFKRKCIVVVFKSVAKNVYIWYWQTLNDIKQFEYQKHVCSLNKMKKRIATSIKRKIKGPRLNLGNRCLHYVHYIKYV